MAYPKIREMPLVASDRRPGKLLSADGRLQTTASVNVTGPGWLVGITVSGTNAATNVVGVYNNENASDAAKLVGQFAPDVSVFSSDTATTNVATKVWVLDVGQWIGFDEALYFDLGAGTAFVQPFYVLQRS